MLEEPISWVGELGAWFVTGYADCLAIVLDSTTFSAALASSLHEDTLGQTMLSNDGARQRQLRQPFSTGLRHQRGADPHGSTNRGLHPRPT
ncbi:MAG: hypothetical protein NVSMB44_36130 [Ktedonobacteraceae bacterium]